MRIRITSLLILLGALILTSCATKEVVYGTYLMPPKKVTKIKELTILEITKPKLEIDATQLGSTFSSAGLAEEISAMLAGSIESQGFYKTADSLWCKNSINHYSKLNRFFAERNRHGYDSFSDFGQNNKPATLNTKIKFTVTKSEGVDTVTKKLTTLSYNIKTSKEGVPYSEPNHKSARITKSTTKISFVNYKIVSNIDLSIFSPNGEKLYSKKSGQIVKLFKVGGDDGRKTIPTISEMVASVFGEYIKDVVKDISPYTETKPLIIKDDGDERAVMLLKAQAYSEALTRLDEVIEKTRKDKEEPEVADLYNFAIALETIGEYSDALSYYQEALKVEPNDQEIITAKNRLTTIYKSKKRLRKSKVRKKNSAYKSKANKQR